MALGLTLLPIKATLAGMENSIGFLSLIPPVLAIGLALYTRQVFLSLAVGIWLGYVILAGGNIASGTFDTINAIVAVFQSAGNTRIILFTLVVGALIVLIQRSGGVQGFINRILAWLERKSENAKTRSQRVRVELLALLTGIVLFIESNISILTVGTLYRPVFDKLSIPREKLAYITDSSSAPSCILLPFNAWGAYIIGLLAAQGLEQPLTALAKATMFNVYPMLVILILIIVIVSGRDIGEMKTAETRARETGALIRPGAQPMQAGDVSATDMKPGLTPKAGYMVIPILTMIVLMPVFLLMTGWEEGQGEFLKIMDAASGSSSVLYATTFACFVAIIMSKISGRLGLRESFDLSLKGMSGMVPLAILMVLAFAIGTLCREMGTGIYVADVASGLISPALIPALVFLIACFIAFSTGTSWGTFAIMIAIAVPLAQSMGASASLAIAAALGGGVFGDHCSPTSDTSIISSMASASDHIDHVRTQLPYALLAGGITTLIYLILGVLSV